MDDVIRLFTPAPSGKNIDPATKYDYNETPCLIFMQGFMAIG